MYVKDGASTRRYLGTFRAIGTTTTTDSMAQRFLFNAQDRVLRKLKGDRRDQLLDLQRRVLQQAGANAANMVELVVGMAAPENISIFEVHHFAANSTGGTTAAAGIGIDSTSVNSADMFGAVLGGANVGSPLHATYSGALAIGYHAVQLARQARRPARRPSTATTAARSCRPGMGGRVII